MRTVYAIKWWGAMEAGMQVGLFSTREDAKAAVELLSTEPLEHTMYDIVALPVWDNLVEADLVDLDKRPDDDPRRLAIGKLARAMRRKTG